MLIYRTLVAAAAALAIATPAAAEVYRVLNAARPGEFLDVDCPQSPEARDLGWVAGNCRLATDTDQPVSQVVVHGWNPQRKQEILGYAEDTARGDPDRPIVIGGVPNPNGRPPPQ